MKKFRFVHCADLHLDSPFSGIGEIYPGIGERLRAATSEAFSNIVKLCLDEGADFLLVAGDVFEHDNPSLKAQLKFRDGLLKLAKAGIHSYIVCGNHDPVASWSNSLNWPEEVHQFTAAAVKEYPVIKSGDEVARIYGISHKNDTVSDNLARLFRRRKEANSFHIGLLHCNIAGSSHYNYAPCSIEDLNRGGMDYWALGHIHKKAVMQQDPPIIYAGNPQGRNFGEMAERGCYMVSVGAPGEIDIAFKAVDAIRFAGFEIDASGFTKVDQLLDALQKECAKERQSSEGRSLIMRGLIKGNTAIHHELSEQALSAIKLNLNENISQSEQFVLISELENRTKPKIDYSMLRSEKTYIGDLLNALDELRNSGAADEINGIADELFYDSSLQKILSPLSKEECESILNEVETLCVDAFQYDD
ncbi:MAG: DNA repair exonuclease [Phycisphaerae bacterium]|nr:DNA repair exonuclease [Phycisphaerae bacterium]